MVKRGSLAGFQDVSNEEIAKVNVNSNININDNDAIQKLMEGTEAKELVGIYFEPAVAKALAKFSKGKKRGFKSDLVNELTKKFLRDNGQLD
jgi:hypothetical protein